MSWEFFIDAKYFSLNRRPDCEEMPGFPHQHQGLTALNMLALVFEHDDFRLIQQAGDEVVDTQADLSRWEQIEPRV